MDQYVPADCNPWQESLYEKFDRIEKMFDPFSPTRVFNALDLFDTATNTEAYALN